MKQRNHSFQTIPNCTEQLFKSWQQNSAGSLSSTEQMEEHHRIVKLLEGKLRQHLSWSLDRVCARGDSQSSMSDSNTVIPDLWVETLSNRPVSTKKVVETSLVIAVIDHMDDGVKQGALERCLGIESLRELVLINLQRSDVEVHRRSREGWASTTYKDKGVVPLETIDLHLNMLEILEYNAGTRKIEVFDTPAVKTYIGGQVPFRPDIQPIESGRGYILRVAEALEYKSSLVLTRMVGSGLELLGIDDEEKIGKLAHILRYPLSKFKRHFFCSVANSKKREFFGYQISISFLNCQSPRLCPVCIAENSICQAVWDISLVAACPIHDCELIDICPKCGESLSWARSSIWKCDCGYDLCEAKVQSVSPHVIAMTKIIHNALHGSMKPTLEVRDINYGPEFLELSLPSLLRVILYLGATFHPSSNQMTQQQFKKTNIRQALEFVEVASLILSDWPKNYRERIRAVSDRYQVEVIVDKKMSMVFGNYYRHLFSVLKESEFNFMRSSFEEYLDDEWDGVIRAQNRLLSNNNDREKKWISPSQASDLSGLPTTAIRRFGKAGVINSKLSKGGPGGQRELWLDRSSVETWAIEVKKWIPRRTVENILDLKPETVMSLGYVGVLKFKRGGCLGKKNSLNFLEEDVQRIVKAFENYNVPEMNHEDIDENQISLSDAIFRFLGREGLPNVISAVIEGKLVPAAQTSKFKGIRGYIFPLLELRKFCCSDIKTPEAGLLTIRETSVVLEVDSRGVSALILGGYLNNAVEQPFRKECLILASEVATFKKQYVFPRELAKLNESSLVWVNKYLSIIGVERIVLKMGSTYYTYMYKRDPVIGINIPQSEYKDKHSRLKLRLARRRSEGVLNFV